MSFYSTIVGSGGGKLRYQEFTSSGTFVPSSALLANGGQVWVFLVGGGGGGGASGETATSAGGGGGGGGGGQVTIAPTTVSGPTSVWIGPGGAGDLHPANGGPANHVAAAGYASEFAGILAYGGGGGAGGAVGYAYVKNGYAGGAGPVGGGGGNDTTCGASGGGAGGDGWVVTTSGTSYSMVTSETNKALYGGQAAPLLIGGLSTFVYSYPGVGIDGFGGGGMGGTGTYSQPDIRHAKDGGGSNGGGHARANSGGGGGGGNGFPVGASQNGGNGASGFCRIVWFE